MLEGRAMMTFLTPISSPVGGSTAGIAVGDYNSDGLSDMAVVNQTTSSINMLLSNGDGSFRAGGVYAAGATVYDAAFGDFNGDGLGDVATAGTNGSVNILLGDGVGGLSAPTAYGAGLGAHSVVAADFNNDGRLDVATMNSSTSSVLLGNGDGTFQARQDTAIPGNSTNAVVGDFNRDGNLDLATSNTASVGTITILRGHGDGAFEPATSHYAFSAPVSLAKGDFNHDGYDDFAVANSYAASSMSVVMNNGDGTYAAPQTYPIGQTGYQIEVEDFDGDGNEDYAVRGGAQLMIHHGNGDGTFLAEEMYSVPSGRFEAGTHGDFNDDGAIDFAYPSPSGVTVVMNANDSVANLAGATGFAVRAPAAITSGSALPLTMSAIDADGNLVPDFQGVVYVASNDPASPSSLVYRFTAADGGTHTFNPSVRLMTVGEQSVTISAPFLPSVTQTVTVAPAVVRLGISAPVAVNAGEAFQVTVSAINALGGRSADYTSTIHFTAADVQAGLPADYTFTADDAGSHTFTATLRTAGSRVVQATEVGGSVFGAATVAVTPGAVSTLTLAGGGGAIGVVRPIAVVGRDVYGNTAIGYSGTVHVTSSDAAAVLPADVSLVNGSGAFSVTLMTVGVQTITATDVADSSITGMLSSDATPPVAARFDVTNFPATTAGAAHNFAVTVRDTIGQVATGYVGTVYFSSSDVQAGLPASYTFTAADGGVHTLPPR
ncbi:MAG: VCBS repeat-containing protein [Pirellulales bacterium]